MRTSQEVIQHGLDRRRRLIRRGIGLPARALKQPVQVDLSLELLRLLWAALKGLLHHRGERVAPKGNGAREDVVRASHHRHIGMHRTQVKNADSARQSSERRVDLHQRAHQRERLDIYRHRLEAGTLEEVQPAFNSGARRRDEHCIHLRGVALALRSQNLKIVDLLGPRAEAELVWLRPDLLAEGIGVSTGRPTRRTDTPDVKFTAAIIDRRAPIWAKRCRIAGNSARSSAIIPSATRLRPPLRAAVTSSRS